MSDSSPQSCFNERRESPEHGQQSSDSSVAQTSSFGHLSKSGISSSSAGSDEESTILGWLLVAGFGLVVVILCWPVFLSVSGSPLGSGMAPNSQNREENFTNTASLSIPRFSIPETNRFNHLQGKLWVIEELGSRDTEMDVFVLARLRESLDRLYGADARAVDLNEFVLACQTVEYFKINSAEVLEELQSCVLSADSRFFNFFPVVTSLILPTTCPWIAPDGAPTS